MLTSIILVICFLFMIFISGNGALSTAYYFFEPTSILLLLVMVIPMIFINHYHKDFLRTFKIMRGSDDYSLHELKMSLDSVDFIRKIILYATTMIAAFYFIILIRTCDDLSAVGPNVNLVLMLIFYMSVFELLLLPLHAKLKKKIYDYMEEE